MSDEDYENDDPLMKHRWYRWVVKMMSKSKLFTFFVWLLFMTWHLTLCLIAFVFVWPPSKRKDFYEYYPAKEGTSSGTGKD